MEKTKAEEPMRTMTKERKKEGPRLGHKGRADAKANQGAHAEIHVRFA